MFVPPEITLTTKTINACSETIFKEIRRDNFDVICAFDPFAKTLGSRLSHKFNAEYLTMGNVEVLSEHRKFLVISEKKMNDR